MRRFAIVLAVLALLAGAVPAPAQDLTDPVVGTAVPFIGPEGDELARFTVAEVIDPFSGYAEFYPPDRGTHYVLVRFDIQNGSRPLQIDPSAFAIQDAEGFLAYPESISLLPEIEEQMPLFGYGEVVPGGSPSGSLVFQVFNGSDPIRILYQPSRDRLLVLADLRAAGAGRDAGAVPTEASAPDLEPGLAPTVTPIAPELPASADAPTLVPTAEPVAPELPGVDEQAQTPTAGGFNPDPTPAEGQAAERDSYAVLLVVNNCPPGTPLPDIQVTPCDAISAGFAVTLAGDFAVLTDADLVTRQAGTGWAAVPPGEYTLLFESLPDGHDAYFVFGDGAEPDARVLGEGGIPVTVGSGAANASGVQQIQVFLVDSQ